MKHLPKIVAILLLNGLGLAAFSQAGKQYQLSSPDTKLVTTIIVGPSIEYSVKHGNTIVLDKSLVSMSLAGGEILGRNVVVSKAVTQSANVIIQSPIYKKKTVTDHYNQLTISCKGNYSVIFRAYDDGVAYRFFTTRKDSLTILNETASFNFDKDYKSYIPYVRDLRDSTDQFIQSFEALYTESKLSGFNKDTLAFLPLLVELNDGKKAAILEADLQDYPGMFITNQSAHGLQGLFAKYPLIERNGGFGNINVLVSKRADYIARTAGTKTFPWRVIVVSSTDKELANSDMVFKLSQPSQISDVSWIKPGKVAWDWWNDWNISHVDFKAGINTPTYKYYIDFAAANKLEYIIIDEGWSEIADLMKILPRIDLQEVIAYGKQKNVGVILWASWYALNKATDEVMAKYAAMGVKGFKIDFLDRDDQKMVASTYTIAKKAAQYKLLVDFHGMFKPTGIQRIYPNVLNFEGVKGLENVKWTPADDVPHYDVSIPFIRMLAGPMDYTPGAMRNATKEGFRFSNSMPMSQGTRCHQLAMYTIFEAPLQMLADNPTAYTKEQESTDFISKVPTTFDETVALDGSVGEYVSIARRKGDTWFVGAMSNWTARELTINFSFLGDGNYEAEIFQDGINADRDATDYKKTIVAISKTDKRTVKLLPGGGWTARIYKK